MSYFPNREGELRDYALNFAALVKAAPVTYALEAGDADQIDQAAQAYAGAYDLAINPRTRTATSLVTKDNAKAAVTAILRGYAMQIKASREVSDESKTNLGIGVYGLARTRVPAPITFPVLKVMGATPLRHELRWNDSGAPDRKARPQGVIGMQLFCQVASASPGNPLDSRFRCFVTRQPYRMEFAAEDKGKTAWYFARWQTLTGLIGQWSQVASMTVAG